MSEHPRGEGPPRLQEFREIVGSSVDIDVDGVPRPLLLSAVHDHGPPVRRPRPRGESFTLLLDDPSIGSPVIASATRPAQHPALGAFTLFLVSHLAPGQTRPRYSATFSRI